MREHVLSLVRRYLTGTLRPSGQSNYLTICPFHKEGRERTPSFSINVDKGLFHCFTCHEAGNLRSLLFKMGVPKSTIDLELRIIQPHLERNLENYKLQKRTTFTRRDPFKGNFILPEHVLALFKAAPQKLIDDGFDPGLLSHMKIGYDGVDRRVIYPLRDFYGNLVGVSGGATDKSQLPKYKVYQGGARGKPGDFGAMFDEQFPGYTCENHEVLWNYDKVFPAVAATSDTNATVYVVEGFKACLWMMQCGYPYTVALMGSYISDTQQRLLHRLGCHVALFLDNDVAGRDATLDVGEKLWRPLHGRVRVVPYPEADVLASIQDPRNNTQPDDYEAGAVNQMTQSQLTYADYFNQVRKNPQWQ